jgi:alpha-beta hydrolase superfamily lysophospholipase
MEVKQKSTHFSGLWGRSMGAATAILYAHMDPSIAGMVLDSPFSSLSTLAKELVEASEVAISRASF